MPGVTAVVPNWNRRDLLERLLEALHRQTVPVAEVVVVDNGSDDGSAEAAAARGARVIRMARNEGFSKAVNRGIREVRTPWIAVVNNDVEPESDWLKELMQISEDQATWFAAGRVLSAARPDSIDGAYDALCRGGCACRGGQGRTDGPQWREPRRIQFAPFTAAIFRRDLFEKVGLLDEQFESYMEDIEFGLRCALAGIGGAYVPTAVAYHQGSATLGAWHPEKVRLIARNQLLLIAKHYPKDWALRYGWAVVVAQTLWGLLAIKHGTGLAWLRGKIEGLRQFRAARNAAPDAQALARILEESERELFTLQQRSGFDLYWRLYLALT